MPKKNLSNPVKKELFKCTPKQKKAGEHWMQSIKRANDELFNVKKNKYIIITKKLEIDSEEGAEEKKKTIATPASLRP